MASDVFGVRQDGYLNICTLVAVTILLLLSANKATVAADQLPPPVNGVPSEATNYPPLPPPPPQPNKARKCDRMFISNANGPANGIFFSPNITNSKEPPPHQCIYTFIANPKQRVKIVFESFNLTGAAPDGAAAGSPPDCHHEYLDLYTELPTPESDLITTPFGGRYCGRLSPRPRISLYRTLVLGFYSDRQDIEGYFQGTYEFVDASRFIIGTPQPNTTCSFVINSKDHSQGELISYTYPGVYPKDITCSYKFRGNRGQRLRLEFMDFDLFYGGPHCPFDQVKFFDGPTLDSPLINTYCGQRRNLVTYSSSEDLIVQFTTLKRTADVTNRGFMAIYEFSEKFVSLNFIKTYGGQHLRGSECDQKILSKKESNGTVVSPNYPFLYQPSKICRYYIYGLQDMQNLEHVRISFEKFEMGSNDDNCTESSLKLYVRGQEDIPAFDKPDHTYCGRAGFIAPLNTNLISEGPRLVMIFTSGPSEALGFKVKYAFETEYLIPGTQAPDRSCQFKYMSSVNISAGDFNTPRHPANYPSNLTCTFMVVGQRREQVLIVFEKFSMKTSEGMYGNSCQNDWVEMYNVYPDDSTQLIGRYCGTTAPGPILSEEGSNVIKVVVSTDSTEVSSGFKVRYIFEPRSYIFGDCGDNITGKEFGLLTSPNYPDKYPPKSQFCNWYIYAKPKHRVVLHFLEFEVEGDPAARGCSSAVVRIWKDLVALPIEICGGTLDASSRQYLSNANVLRIMFISANKSVSAGGFKAVWTEISEDPACDMFSCKTNGFCIPKTLHCNGIANCGHGDDSDEQNCVENESINLYLLVGVSTGIAVVILLIICLWCHRKHKRRRSESTGVLRTSDNRLAHSCEVSGARFSSMDSV